MRPEVAEVFERRAHDGEAFRPHTLREEGVDAGDAIAREGARGASSLELMGRGEGKEVNGGGLSGMDEGKGDAMVNDLEGAPCA